MNLYRQAQAISSPAQRWKRWAAVIVGCALSSGRICHATTPTPTPTRPSRAYAVQFNSRDVAVIDVPEMEPREPLRLDEYAEGIALAPDGGYAVVTQPPRSVSVIDALTGTTQQTFQMSDYVSGKVVVTQSYGPWAVVLGYASVTRIDLRTSEVGTPLPLNFHAVDFAVAPDGSRAYLLNREANEVVVADLEHGFVETAISLRDRSDYLSAAVVSPDGSRLFVAGSCGLTLIATAGNEIINYKRALTNGFHRIAVDPLLYVSDEGVRVIDVQSLETLAYASAPGRAYNMAVTPDGHFALLAKAGIQLVDLRKRFLADGLPIRAFDLAIGPAPEAPFTPTPEPSPPSNDACVNAVDVPQEPYTDEVYTRNATSAGPRPACGDGPTGKTIWYRYTAIVDGDIHADTFGTNYDTVLASYTGSCDALIPVENGCSDDVNPGYKDPSYYSPRNSELFLSGLRGATYYFAVSAEDDGGTAVFHFGVPTATAPSHTPTVAGNATPTATRCPTDTSLVCDASGCQYICFCATTTPRPTPTATPTQTPSTTLTPTPTNPPGSCCCGSRPFSECLATCPAGWGDPCPTQTPTITATITPSHSPTFTPTICPSATPPMCRAGGFVLCSADPGHCPVCRCEPCPACPPGQILASCPNEDVSCGCQCVVPSPTAAHGGGSGCSLTAEHNQQSFLSLLPLFGWRRKRRGCSPTASGEQPMGDVDRG